jgi:hypothetical protein
MGKISDIWVRLGLKKDGFDKGMDDAAKKADKTGGKMSKMLNAAKAGWAAVGAAVIAFGHEMINATNKVGDAWNHTMAGIKGGWQSVLADISNYKPDFSSFRNFFKNEWKWIKDTFGSAKEAGEAAREMSKAFDAEFELENSLKIQRAKISGELADLQVEMRNTALSPQERKAATERYRALLEPLYKAEIATRKNMLDEAVKAWLAGTGVSASTQQVSDFFANYGINPTAAAAANPELARVYETRKGDKANQPIFDAITKLAIAEGGLANELKLVNRTANSIDKLISDNKLDAGALTDSLLEGIDEDIEDELAELEEMFQDMQLVIPPIDTSALDAGLAEIQAQAAEYAAELAQIDQMNMMLEDSIMSAMGNGMQALADMMMGLEGADMKNVLAAFIAPLGDTMKQMGAMIMAEGVAMEAFKKSFKNPYAAIAAGAALMAIGSVVSAGLQRLTANPMGGGSGASYGGAGSYGSSELTNYENTLTIEVTGKISGSDIVISGNKTNNKWNR